MFRYQSIPSNSPRAPHVSPATTNPSAGLNKNAPVVVIIINDAISRLAVLGRVNQSFTFFIPPPWLCNACD